ncbi:hypothetical protein HYV10_03385 [Candidatus Dependentiae bacterium]|nr:hypothetical protein [Candidatus Dependentiae bacterium]
MKKYILKLFLTASVISFIDIQPEALPSVADVFGNMTEEEITKQVQMGQQFLADLEKYGTPEEKTEFEKILLETLNSMSEQDFEQIQSIAKMVEPHLQPAETQPTTTQPVPTPKPEEIAPKISEDTTEKFKNLITAIINRIDEILQKIESSKECKEELDVRWSNRTTFSSMKRQIAQLKNNKLAEKLSQKDISQEDKKIVESLESFLKELTEKNSKLLIEDTFGLSDNKELENKYLKQTKEILSLFDSFIDSLMPKIEKFLGKWDPEALQLAKEAAQKVDKATQDAKDALKRIPSADARSTQQDRSQNQRGSMYRDYETYPDYGSYNYSPDMYDQYNQGARSNNSENVNSNEKSGSKLPAAPKSPATGKDSQIDQKLKDQDKDKVSNKPNIFDDIMDSIDSHFDQYSNATANQNINFLDKIVNEGYKALTPALDAKIRTWGKNESGDDASGSKPNTEGVSEWIYRSFIPYTESVYKQLDNDYQKFSTELDSAKRLFSKIEESAKDLSAEEIKKVSAKIDTLEKRFISYHDVYNSTMDTVNNNFKTNFSLIANREIVGDEIQDNSDKPQQAKDIQHKFIDTLKTLLGDKISSVVANVNTLKSNIERKIKRKSKSSKSSSVIMDKGI